MLKQNLIFRNPLRLMGDDGEEILPGGGFGAILARAGMGKTALLVQIAFDKLLRNRDVVHVSLDDPIKKVCLWYDEVFDNIKKEYGQKHSKAQFEELWQETLRHRFIMTYNIEGLSVPKLEERLVDLVEQGIRRPGTLLIDGLSFDDVDRELLAELKKMAKLHNLHVWFAVRTHRHEERNEDGLPQQLHDCDDLFEVVLQLQPEGKEVHVEVLKGDLPPSSTHELILEPSTMLIKNRPLESKLNPPPPIS